MTQHLGPSTKRLSRADYTVFMSVSDLRKQLNMLLHRQTIRKLTPEEITLARDWCMMIIEREHPDFTPEQAELYYDRLINVRITVVDEWSQRME